MVSRDFLGLGDLTRAQTLCIYKFAEVIIVSKDEDLKFAAFKVVTPSLEGPNNGQKLLIVRFVPSLSEDRFFREKGY